MLLETLLLTIVFSSRLHTECANPDTLSYRFIVETAITQDFILKHPGEVKNQLHLRLNIFPESSCV